LGPAGCAPGVRAAPPGTRWRRRRLLGPRCAASGAVAGAAGGRGSACVPATAGAGTRSLALALSWGTSFEVLGLSDRTAGRVARGRRFNNSACLPCRTHRDDARHARGRRAGSVPAVDGRCAEGATGGFAPLHGHTSLAVAPVRGIGPNGHDNPNPATAGRTDLGVESLQAETGTVNGVDLTYPPEAEEFRAEIAGWLKDNLPQGWGEPGHAMTPEERKAFNDEWTTKLFEGGWICASWPSEYGGKGLTLLQQVVLNEEFARAGAPLRGDFFGDTLV